VTTDEGYSSTWSGTVGSRGLSEAREMLLGSTSHGCVHHATVPVVIVPGSRCNRRTTPRLPRPGAVGQDGQQGA
jgi:hypothetical protein